MKTCIQALVIMDFWYCQRMQEIGSDVKEITGLNDWIFDVSITANRPDCQSIFGLAREVAAALGQPLKMPALDYTETEVEKPGFDVTVESPGSVPPLYCPLCI